MDGGKKWAAPAAELAALGSSHNRPATYISESWNKLKPNELELPLPLVLNFISGDIKIYSLHIFMFMAAQSSFETQFKINDG